MFMYDVQRCDDYGVYTSRVYANCEVNAILAVKKIDWAKGYVSYGYVATLVK